MATGDGRASYERGAASENFSKSLFRPEINEEPQNVSQEAMANKLKNSTGASEISTQQGGNLGSISVTVGKSEAEQMLKQMTFTGLEASTTSDSLQKLDNGDKSDNFHATIVNSRVVEEAVASPAELAEAYKGSTSGTGQALREDLHMINNNATCLSKTPMAAPQQPATMENLPNDLLSNIFIRLFAKQLAQMRSVSKSWNALLSQSSFIKSHLRHSIQNNHQILLMFYDKDNSSSHSKQFTAHSCRFPHLELTDFIKLPFNPGIRNAFSVIGCVNGLICSCYGDYVIQIWNPSLSAVSTLPPYSEPSVYYYTMKSYFRFGFDPKTDDYKLVKLTGFTGTADGWWMDVEIFSMRKGSWNLITERPPSHITGIRGITDQDLIYVDGHDGHLHWLGHYFSGKGYTETIVAFDLGSKTFSEIPFPDSILNDNNYRFTALGVLAGKLCVLSWAWDGTCDVWVMDKYGVSESWVKRHVFSQFIGNIVPYGFTSQSEFLINDNNRFVLYDPVAKKAKIFEKVCFKSGGPSKIVEYVDSLVWVAPAEHEMVDGAGQIRN